MSTAQLLSIKQSAAVGVTEKVLVQCSREAACSERRGSTESADGE